MSKATAPRTTTKPATELRVGDVLLDRRGRPLGTVLAVDFRPGVEEVAAQVDDRHPAGLLGHYVWEGDEQVRVLA